MSVRTPRLLPHPWTMERSQGGVVAPGRTARPGILGTRGHRPSEPAA